jgi:hypothetical protein
LIISISLSISRLHNYFDGPTPAITLDVRLLKPALRAPLAVLVYAAGGGEVYPPMLNGAMC